MYDIPHNIFLIKYPCAQKAISALKNHSKKPTHDLVISSFCDNLMEWMHSNILQPDLKTARLWWINCSALKRPTGNECLSIAHATPLPGSLQPSTTPGVMNVFFNHLHCGTSTMAQVPTLVGKSLFNAMQLPLSNMKTLFWSCCNYLKQLSPPYASKGAKITQPIMVGYELVMEKVWNCFSNLYYWPIEPAEQS